MKILWLLLLCAATALRAEDFTVEVSKVIGNAQIKREGSRKWDKAREGKGLADNDILQTSFKSNIEIRFGKGNLLFLGSGSRTLLNVIQKPGSEPEVTFTVFSGSLYSKITGGVKFSVYTSTALAKTGKGVFNSTADEISGLSGFHVFSGTISVGNISLKSEKNVSAGRTTTVGPGEDPTDAKKISAKQMAVLTGFYGSEFINQEIEATGVEIESEGEESYRPAVEKEAPSAGQEAFNKDRMPKSMVIFDYDLILKRLREEEERKSPMFAYPVKSDPLNKATYFGAIAFSSGAYRGRNFADLFFRPGYRFERGHVALNLPFVADSAARFVIPLSGTRAYLDKIYSAEVRLKKNYLRLGPLDEFTLGEGLIMEDYSNRVRGDNVRDLGLFLHMEGYLSHLDVFSAGAADFRLAGANFALSDSVGYFGLCAVREGDPLQLNGGDLGFRAGPAEFPTGIAADSVPGGGPMIFAELDASRNLFLGRPYSLEFHAALAGMFEEGSGNLKGHCIVLPRVTFTYGRSRYGFDFFFTRNRFVRGYMNRFYEDNRLLFRYDSLGLPDTAVTLGGAIPKKQFPVGLRVNYAINPWRGIALSTLFETVFKHFETGLPDTGQSKPPPKLVGGPRNGKLLLRLTLGKDFNQRLPWGEAYYSIDHVGFFSNSGMAPFDPNPYTEFGFKFSYLVYPGLVASAGFDRFFYDANGDGLAGPDESAGGFNGGVSAGF